MTNFSEDKNAYGKNAGHLSVRELFHAVSDEFWHWCLTKGTGKDAYLTSCLPKHPDENIQNEYYDGNSDEAMQQAYEFYRLCKKQLSRLNKFLNADAKVLDFACGWGGLQRFLIKDVYAVNLVAVDHSAEAMQACHQSNLSSEFIQIPEKPPLLLFADRTFEVIFAYSISSRITEKDAWAWMQEFERLLKPGGVICLSAGEQKADQASQANLSLATQTSLYSEIGIRKYGRLFNTVNYYAANTMPRFNQHLIVLQKREAPSSSEVLSEPASETVIATKPGVADFPWTGERLVTQLRGPIVIEHLHRYAMAVELAAGKKVLDIACGEGYGTKLLARRAEHVLGVDIDKAVIKHAKAKYPAANCEFKAGSAVKIPVADHSIDLAVSFETIEHVEDYKPFLAELKRCLKPDGVLIISSPDKEPYNKQNPELNHFHIHEMSHAEFTGQLQGQFKNIVTARQRIVQQASYIAPDKPDATGIRYGNFIGGFHESDYTPGIVNGIYSIAVCSDAIIDKVSMGVFEGVPEVSEEVYAQLEEAKRTRSALLHEIEIKENILKLLNEFIREKHSRLMELDDKLQAARHLQQQLQAQNNILSEELGRAHEQSAKLKQENADLQLRLSEQYRKYEDEKKAVNHLSLEVAESKRLNKGWEIKNAQVQKQAQILRQRVYKTKNDLKQTYNRFYSFRGVVEGVKKAAARKVVKVNRTLEREMRQAAAGGGLFLKIARKVTGRILRKWQVRKENIFIIEGSNLFEQAYYAEQYPGVDFNNTNPIVHFLSEGTAAGKNPNKYFDGNYYLAQNADVAELGINPFIHFITMGARQERDPGPGFNTLHYLENNPDVAQADMAPFLHYYFFGKNENRSPVIGNGSGTLAGYQMPFGRETQDVRRFTDDCFIEKDPECFTKRRRAGKWQDLDIDYPTDVRPIAFYLPQYHPVPENDEWWGEGFTEWENVARARPLFPGHYQPHLPADLGFYDLRIPEVREKQAAMAKAFGIHGFCYYYYWFNGRRVLERPLQELLESGRPDFPFCICWANENWTRVWDGQEKHVLLGQKHSLKSDIAFMHDVLPILKDPRYIRFQGKPVLLVYRADKLHHAKKTTEAWREICRQEGLDEIHLCAIKFEPFEDPRQWGFDAFVEFPPNSFYSPNIAAQIPGLEAKFTGRIADYNNMITHSLNYPKTEYTYHRGTMLMWDNTPRRRYQSILYHNAGPETYEKWLSGLVTQARASSEKESLIFINAWNEWGEGTHLEPDQKYGFAFLEATSRALIKPLAECDEQAKQINGALPEKTKDIGLTDRRTDSPEGLVLIVHDALYYGVQFLALAIAKMVRRKFKRPLFIILKNGGDLESEFHKAGTTFNLTTETSRQGSEAAALATIWQKLETAGVKQALACTVVAGNVAFYLKQRGMEVITLVNEMPTTIESRGYQTLTAQTIQASDKLVFPSHYVSEAFALCFGGEPQQSLIRPQGVLEPNGYLKQREQAKQAIAKKHELGDHPTIIMNCAAGGIRKGPDIFLTVANKVLDHDALGNIHFIWVGELSPEVKSWCEHDLAQLENKERIHFVGFQKDVAKYMAASELFLLTSREDPFPNVMLSAMEAGMPVIAFEKSGGASELLRDNQGLLVPFLDVAAMANEVVSLLQKPEKRKSIGQNARSIIEKEFQFEDYVAFLLKPGH